MKPYFASAISLDGISYLVDGGVEVPIAKFSGGSDRRKIVIIRDCRLEVGYTGSAVEGRWLKIPKVGGIINPIN